MENTHGSISVGGYTTSIPLREKDIKSLNDLVAFVLLLLSCNAMFYAEKKEKYRAAR